MSRAPEPPAGITTASLVPAGYYLSTAQAAEELQITPDAVLDAIHRGRLLRTQVDGYTLLNAEEVARYRDTRRGGGGRTQAEQDAMVPSPDRGQRWPVESDWKGTAVVWRAADGRQLRITYHQAEALAHLAGYANPRPEGLVSEHLHSEFGSKWSRTRVRHLVDSLAVRGFIARVVIRDRQGAGVHHLLVTTTGHDALRYCRERGLI